MSKLDLNLYVAQCLAAYNSAKETLDNMNECYTGGYVTEEDCINALAEFENAKLIYETALVCANENNKPRDKKKHRTDQFTKDWYNATNDKWIKEALYDDNINIIQPIIDKFKEFRKNGNTN